MNLFYLTELLENSISFTDEEKFILFEQARNNPKRMLEIIDTLEEEKKQLEKIKEEYEYNVAQIGKNLTDDLLEKEKKLEEEKKQKLRNKVKNKLKKIKEKEQKEKENADLLINQL